MDVQSWLGQLADGATPPLEERIVTGFPERRQSRSEKRKRRYHHRKRSVDRDTSITGVESVAPRTGEPSGTHAYAQPQRIRARSSFSSSPASSSRSTPHVGLSPITQPKTYSKRKRHKTRPDRYDPKPARSKRKRGTRRQGAKDGHEQRKAKRRNEGRRAADLLHDFQLQNGPKNSRLTLRAEIAAGLFKHGRASAQAAGRGAGLPDLVFNEMKFLQKPNVHQVEPENTVPPDHKINANPKDLREQEVSAYFRAPSPQTRHHVTQNRRNGQRSEQSCKTVSPSREKSEGNRPPSADRTSASHRLPCSSKGIDLKDRQPRSEKTEYLPWSLSQNIQSARCSRSTAGIGKNQTKPWTETERPDSTSSRKPRSNLHPDIPHDGSRSVPANVDERVRDLLPSSRASTLRRFAELNNTQTSRKAHISSMPLPGNEHCHSFLSAVSQHGASDHHSPRSYRTSSILNIRSRHGDNERTFQLESNSVHKRHEDKAQGADPRSSDSIGHLLQQTHQAAIDCVTRAPTTESVETKRAESEIHDAPYSLLPLSHSRQNLSDHIAKSRKSTAISHTPHSHDTYEIQEKSHHNAATQPRKLSQRNRTTGRPPTYSPGSVQYPHRAGIDDGKMLYNRSVLFETPNQHSTTYSPNWRLGGSALDISRGPSILPEGRTIRSRTASTEYLDRARMGIGATEREHAEIIGDDRSVVDEFAGFWRRQRLY